MKNVFIWAGLIAALIIPVTIDAQSLPGYSAISGGSKRSGIRIQGLLGIDFAGKHVLEYHDEEDTSLQFSPDLEIMYEKGDFSAGIGLEYHYNYFYGEQSPYRGYRIIPVYFSGRYSKDLNWLTTVEGLVNMGYGFFNPDYDLADESPYSASGGLYFGIGAGVILDDRYVIQIMYKYNQAALIEEVDAWIDYTEVYRIANSGLNLSLGYRY